MTLRLLVGIAVILFLTAVLIWLASRRVVDHEPSVLLRWWRRRRSHRRYPDLPEPHPGNVLFLPPSAARRRLG